LLVLRGYWGSNRSIVARFVLLFWKFILKLIRDADEGSSGYSHHLLVKLGIVVVRSIIIIMVGGQASSKVLLF